MSTRPEEKEAEAFAKRNRDPWDKGDSEGNLKEGYLAGATAEAKKAVEMKERLKAAEEALRFYAQDSIDHHNYHATMNTTLTGKAKEYFEKYPQAGRDP